ncbi:MAG: aromatic amino acid lyase, partial [Phycisphaerales bacterium]
MTAAQPASTSASPVVLDGRALTIADVARVARATRRAPVPVTIAPAALERIRASRAVVEQALAGGKAVYGLNTGFGSLSRVRVEHSRACDLQRNIIRSHAAGVGEHLPLEVSRALVLILAASLA